MVNRWAVVVLTREASHLLKQVDDLVSGAAPAVKLLMDSSVGEETRARGRELGWEVERLTDFDHGRARRSAFQRIRWSLGPGDGVVFVTQDVFGAGQESGQAVVSLVRVLTQDKVGAAYGRQLPRPGAGPFEAHARLFNYPDRSEVRSMEDSKRLGIKACFFSDSFAAYRLEALEQVGGFPERAIVGEDVIVAAKLLKAGWKIAYVADACVYHSHDLTPLQEMRRYFDIGVFHARESWILREFGKPEGEGLRFLRSELRYLWQHAPWRIPESFLRAALKYFGYRLGRAERWLPLGLKRWLSLQKHFWDREAEELRARKRGDRARGE
jgi:rhamnosyltransferase